jgi:phosphate-selective porin
MRKRISVLIAALMLALTMSFGSAAAFAAPIECKGNKVIVKTAEGWQCVSPQSGNEAPGTEDPKNPNADRDKF